MDDLSLSNEGLGFEVLASSLRADLSDTKAFEARWRKSWRRPSPAMCRRAKGALFSKEKHVHRVRVELGEHQYAIERRAMVSAPAVPKWYADVAQDR